ncbi:fimbrial protein [Scandinavium manionii]|uniref:fimbrial protein n=1 Tax=Scandinavium manionii TaxID=2926520 RepID=UPI00135C390F|nr:fimbrial protein [Scandinavium manionii]MCS2149611.1 fimbrial protein [Scandinavium manionii]
MKYCCAGLLLFSMTVLAETGPVLTSSPTSYDQQIYIDGDNTSVANRKFSYPYTFRSLGSSEYTGQDASYMTDGVLAYGPQFVSASWDPSAIDTSDSKNIDGITYYRYKRELAANLYIAIQQGVYSNQTQHYIIHDVPFSGVSNYGVSRTDRTAGVCEGTRNSTWAANITCDGASIKLVKDDGIAARVGTVLLYFAGTPSSPINFSGVTIARLSVGDKLMPGGNENDSYNGSYTTYGTISLTGNITFVNSCNITESGTVQVPFGEIPPSIFTTKGSKPSNNYVKKTEIHYQCEFPIHNAQSSGVKWMLEATGASKNAEQSNGLLAAVATGSNTINNLGIKVTRDESGANVVDTTGATSYDTTYSSDDKQATATFYAYPTMINDTKPKGGGDFKATATLRFDIP